MKKEVTIQFRLPFSVVKSVLYLLTDEITDNLETKLLEKVYDLPLEEFEEQRKPMEMAFAALAIQSAIKDLKQTKQTKQTK